MPTEVSSDKHLKLETVQWTRLRQIEDIEPINNGDYEVLEEIRQVLLRRGFEDRFGVCLLHKHFDIQPGEAFLEDSDEQKRISTIRVVTESEARQAMETAWAFSPADNIQAGRKCRVVCQGFGLTGHQRKHNCEGTI